jgi:hypothetical protein
MNSTSEVRVAQQVTDVPKPEVGTVVQDFIDDGNEKVLVERQPDGNFTVSVP